MNLDQTRVVIRARGIPEVFDLSLHFVAALGSRLFFKLWLLLGLPGFGLCLWLRSRDVSFWLVWAVALAWFALAQAFFTRACSKLLFTERLDLRAVLARPFQTLGRQILVCVTATLAAAAALIAIPLLPIVLVRLVYLSEIVLLEGFGVVAAWQRASRFTANRFVSAFESVGLLSAMLLCFVGFGELIGDAVFVELLSFPPLRDQLFENAGSVFSLFGFFASLPFVTATRFLCYIDGRTRREAWDVQVRFAQLAARAGGAPS